MGVHEKIGPSVKYRAVLEGEFRLFGVGNEKRDLVLLVRGDIEVDRAVCASFFACLHCGHMSMGTKDFQKADNTVIMCTKCEMVGMVYYFDGVWKGSRGKLRLGYCDNKVRIERM